MGAAVLTATTAFTSAQETNSIRQNPMPRPKVIIFDVNETLLDLAPLKVSVGKALGGREDLLPLWFSTMLHYSLVETLSDNYHAFGEIGTAALMMVAETQGIKLSDEDAKEAIVTPLRSLPPHPDVIAGLKALKEDGYRIVSLTNSSAIGVETQMNNAGLTNLFEKHYTIETIKKYKPHPDTYRMVLDDIGVEASEVLMIAAHAWDLAGAKNVGLQTAFVARPGKTLYPNVDRPDYVVNDLGELVKVLTKTEAASNSPSTKTNHALTPKEASKALVTRFFTEVWNPPFRIETIDELVADDFIITTDGQDITGRTEFKKWVQGLSAKVINLKVEIDEMLVTDDGARVITRMVSSGRNNGILGTEPNGAPVKFSVISVIEVKDGKIAHNWVEKSAFELHQRLTSTPK